MAMWAASEVNISRTDKGSPSISSGVRAAAG